MEFPELPGVLLSLSLEGEDIPISPDGRIEKTLDGGTSLILGVEVFSGTDMWHPFTVDYNDRTRMPVRSRPTILGKKDGSKTFNYQRKIPLKRTRQGNKLVTYSQHNNLRMMFLNDTNIDVVTVALVVQDGIPWLTADITFQATINEGTIEFDRSWPTLFRWVDQIRGRLHRYKEVEPSLPEPEAFADKTGLVIWWDSSMANAGSGCVMTNKGQVSVHWGSIKRQDSPRRFLKVGERISFKFLERRDDFSNFPFQLRGVTPTLP